MIMIVGAALYQWDTRRYVTTNIEADHIHFSNKGDSKAVIMDLVDSQAKVPDYLLQTGKQLCVYVVRDGVTVESRVFSVTLRERPEDYIYEEDQRNFVYALIADAQAATEAAKQAAKEATDVSDAIKKDAASGKFKGDKGEKGEKGDPGEQGPKGDPGDAGDTLNDRVISTEHSWSSKNTVDELCPSFTESGAAVVCEPLEGYPLTVISYIGQDGASKITLRQDNDEESLDYTVDLPYSISDASYNWTTGTLLTADDEEIQLAPQVITALYGKNTFYSDCGSTTVIGKVDPNKYWAEKLAEQEAIIAEQEAELAKLNKQYELIEDITLTEVVAHFERKKDTNGVAYNFSKLKIVVNFAAAASNTQAVFCCKDANGDYIFYQTSANGSIGTAARKSIVTVYNDGGLVNYNALCAVNTTQTAYYAFPSYCGREWRNIATLRITTYPSSDTIPAGTTIKIYGIRG